MRRIIIEELDLSQRDMLELKERNAAGQLQFLSHKEVWGAGKEETYGSSN